MNAGNTRTTFRTADRLDEQQVPQDRTWWKAVGVGVGCAAASAGIMWSCYAISCAVGDARAAAEQAAKAAEAEAQVAKAERARLHAIQFAKDKAAQLVISRTPKVQPPATIAEIQQALVRGAREAKFEAAIREIEDRKLRAWEREFDRLSSEAEASHQEVLSAIKYGTDAEVEAAEARHAVREKALEAHTAN